MSNLHDKEAFFKKAREMAEGLTREQLIGYYMNELETCCEVEEELKEKKIFAGIDGYLEAQKEYQSQIADLEAKLAEKDRQLKVMRELKNRHYNYYKTCETECSQLKQQLEEKETRIAELEEQLKNAIIPKFNRQEHIYSFAFGEIREFIVVAYLDNNTTLCEDTKTSHLEWSDNDFLVLTYEEAQAKLEESQGGNK